MSSSSPNRRLGGISLIALGLWIGLVMAISIWMAGQAQHWLPVQASNAAPLVDGLFRFETGVGTFVFLGVVSVMAWTMLVHRAEKYDESDAEPIEGNTRLEVIWTVIPLVLVMAIAWYAIQVNTELGVLGPMEHIHPRDAQEELGGYPGDRLPPEQVEVIARQWSWEFVYPDGVRSAELHLPVNRPVRFRLVSLDVLHGLSIPAFRLRQDVVPGSVIDYRLTPSREGRYRLRDSLFSGAYFASNQTDVVVESPEAFEQWRQAARRSPLVPSPNAAAELWSQRQERGNRGWATVPPGPPPLVNVPLDLNAAHEG